MGIFNNIKKYIKSHSVIAGTVAVIAVMVMVIAGRVAERNKNITSDASNNLRQVSIIDVDSFRNGTSTIRTDGTVESVSQVDLKSQISAPVARNNVAIGDNVYAGQVLVEFSNADIRAGLDQAKASLSLAKGQYSTGGISLDSARRGAIDKVRSSYTTTDGIIRGQVDQFLLTTNGGNAPLISYTSDYKLSDDIRNTRGDLTKYFTDWKKMADALSADTSTDTEISAALDISKKVIDTASRLLDSMSVVLNVATKNAPDSTISTINAWKSIITAGHAALSGEGSGVSAADAALSGNLSSHGSSAEAQVSIAEAGVKNLEAQLAKTIITSPISGKVASLPLRVGELSSPGQLIATVVGGGGLEVKAYVSSDDISRIVKGASVTISGAVSPVFGTVARISPSVNEINKKVEIGIAINSSDESVLVVGQNVSVSIKANEIKSSADNIGTTAYILPIQNIKIIPGDAFVFTVDGDSKIVKHAVTLGKVDGDFIEVKTGLISGMKIVSPVYELEEGQAVDVR